MADGSDYTTILQQLLAHPLYGQTVQQAPQSWTQDLSQQADRWLKLQQGQYLPQQPVAQEGGYTIAPPPPGGWTLSNLAASGLPGAAGFYGFALPDDRLTPVGGGPG